MPTQEERLTSLERNFAQFKQDSKMQTRRHHEDDTIILGVLTKKVEETNHKLHIIDNRLDTMDHRIEVIENRIDAVENRLNIVENRLDAIENRLNIVENRLDAIENRLDTMDGRLAKLEKISEANSQMLTAHGQLLKLILERLPERKAS